MIIYIILIYIIINSSLISKFNSYMLLSSIISLFLFIMYSTYNLLLTNLHVYLIMFEFIMLWILI